MSKTLTPPSVYMRIRPQTDTGGHAQSGQAVAKTLEGWDDTSVTVGWTCANQGDMGRPLERGLGQRYPVKRVLGPEASQSEVYDAVVPEAVDRVLGRHGAEGDDTVARPPTNALVFAYGQTGTGKTHTTLGPDASLKDVAPPGGEIDERWGIFPRAVYDIYDKLEASGRPFVLAMSALEFYQGVANDLMAVNSPICLSNEHEPLGMCQITLMKREDIIPIIMRVRSARHTRHTRMNMAGGQGGDDDHGGSSRGHAMLILTVIQLNKDRTEMARSTFSLVDLAGAERPDKTGAARVGVDEYMKEFITSVSSAKQGKKFEFSIGAQAFMINYELYTLGDQAKAATDYYKGWKKGGQLFRTPTTMVTDGVRMLGTCFAGHAHVSVIVTLSQAPQCGWETWFSCRYAQDLAKMRAPLQAQKWTSLGRVLKDLHANIQENVKALDKPINNKVARFKRVGTVTGSRIRLAVIRELALRYSIPSLDANSIDTFDLPVAETTGWKFGKSRLQGKYELCGMWDTRSLESFLTMMDGMSDPTFVEDFQKQSIQAQRYSVNRMLDTLRADPVNASWQSRCPASQPVIVDTTAYPPCDNRRVKVYIHRPEGLAKDKVTPALVYAHGGGGLYGKAMHLESHCARYAIEAQVTVFNVEYRLAPEHKTPAGIYDATGVVLHLYDNASKYGIDPSRIAVMGESAGGWIAAGCAMELAVRGKADALKLCVPVAPMVSDIIIQTPPYRRIEGGKGTQVAWQFMVDSIKGSKSDPKYMWITKASPSVFKAFPKTAIVTSEFDLCRRMGEDLGEKLDKAGRLVEFLVHPGGEHCWHSYMSWPNSDMYWNDVRQLLLDLLVSEE